jgi:ABC-type multidrug transport system ATPase subunit
MSLRLEVENVSKRFGRKSVFSPVSFTATQGDIIAIVGSNGSGKSTLLKIIAGVLSPSSGKSIWFENDKPLDEEALAQRIGFVAPYLELYNELTAVEHVNFIGQLKGLQHSKPTADYLTQFGLDKNITISSRLVGHYSSGMKQRVTLAMSSVGDPDILLYDEPSSALDEDGIKALFDYIHESSSQGKIVILATNDLRERDLAHRTISLRVP